MSTSASDQGLLARQAALQAEATHVLAELDRWEIYTAVLRDVRTPEQFARWLAANGFPILDAAAMGTNAR